MIGWALLAGLAALAAAPFAVEWRKPPMSDARRAAAPGHFARLSRGGTHYRWYGDRTEGPVAVCVHGLTTPSFVWDGVAADMVAHGWRVLAFDLYGRGWSDRPPGPQDREFFLEQLEEIIRHEGLKGDITLVGYSMGGAIAACYAARNPQMLRRLALIAPAGMGQVPQRLERRCAGWPVLGDWLFRPRFPRRHRRAAELLHRNEGVAREVAAAQAAELDTRGFVPAVLSSLRGMLSETLETEHRAIAAAKLPVLAIWATADALIPLSHMGRLTAWNRDAQQVQVKGASHWLPLTHPREVARALRGSD